ncbi:hypothetical protein DPMN_159343 [Dreissena polymorpha]|uniref:Uncharacterized protein n=1 Tax=Dreissena polymorpha TaxID=45954 RepID=A0A9D4ELJ1_DREPO|nr:hypothetical protein DPMN_159343 [Dreissena polymorpha]
MAASNVRSDLGKGIKKIMVVFPNIEHKYQTSVEVLICKVTLCEVKFLLFHLL